MGTNSSKVDGKLARYFHVTDAKIGILTDGVVYKFYSDIDNQNIMDSTPFFEVDLTNTTSQELMEIAKFAKDGFDVDSILCLASDLKIIDALKEKINSELFQPSEEFVKIIISEIHEGQKNKTIIDKYQPMIKKAFHQIINDRVATKLSNAISGITKDEEMIERVESKIVTTEDEMQFYQIIKSMLVGIVELERITYRDAESYFNVLLDDNGRKWICRIKFLKDTTINIYLNDQSDTIKINSLDESYEIREKIIDIVKDML